METIQTAALRAVRIMRIILETRGHLHAVKRLQVLLFNTNYFIKHYSFIVHSNDYKYCFVIPIIQFRLTVKEFQVFLFNTNIYIRHYSFVCSPLNGSKNCYVSLNFYQISVNFLHTIKWSNSSILNNSV